MEALRTRLLDAAGNHQLHIAIADLLEVPAAPIEPILVRLSVLATFIRLMTPEMLIGLNADDETPYEALKHVTRWVHGPDIIQQALYNQTLGLVMRATPLVWTAMQMPQQPAAAALAIRALRQGGVNPLLQWAGNPGADHRVKRGYESRAPRCLGGSHPARGASHASRVGRGRGRRHAPAPSATCA